MYKWQVHSSLFPHPSFLLVGFITAFLIYSRAWPCDKDSGHLKDITYTMSWAGEYLNCVFKNPVETWYAGV